VCCRKSLICIRPVDRLAGRGLDGNTHAPLISLADRPPSGHSGHQIQGASIDPFHAFPALGAKQPVIGTVPVDCLCPNADPTVTLTIGPSGGKAGFPDLLCRRRCCPKRTFAPRPVKIASYAVDSCQQLQRCSSVCAPRPARLSFSARMQPVQRMRENLRQM
jgi:hypothetical protein